ncbi:acyltransferase [Qipengyuania gelatinilytica]|uniref:Acyltransferase n=2 Tax=Qipengyuania gelatinilytica TaxID=2867231 RepID=A0ABX9A1F5_9SPHN|nr:acyltransferase [Qipengyuania gelatinilytica]
MYVHVVSGSSGFPVTGQFSADDVLFRVFATTLGQASVPLLTVLSGWLAYSTTKAYPEMLRGKVGRLVVPLILWNAVMLLLMVAHELAGGREDLPRTLRDWFTALSGIGGKPANIPLGFLRDLFLTFAIFPLLRWIVDKWGPFAVLLAFAFTIIVPTTPVLQRTMILAFFTLGLWLRSVEISKINSKTVALCAIWAVTSLSYEFWSLATTEPAATSRLVLVADRVAIAGIMWALCYRIAGTSLGQNLTKISPIAFFLFCVHFPLFRVLAVPLQPIFGELGEPLFPIYFMIQPILGLIACFLIAKVVQPYVSLQKILNGGRPMTLGNSRTGSKRSEPVSP